ncbi:MAG: hypothetical protein QOG01_2119 [Pseudonocardiales bacterium]|jgi:hypothetical protein|nr:hypothetical protein [Pseudonocardiales bacterium]
MRTATAGLLLIVLGAAFWILSRYQSGREQHSYSSGGAPPATVHLTQGHTYWLSIAGGVQREVTLGLDPAALQCTQTGAGSAPRVLVVSPEAADTKLTHQIASFVAPLTGDVHVGCDGLGTVYIDDADNSYDYAGLWLVLAAITLTIGIPLSLAPVVVGTRRSATTEPEDPEFDPADADDSEPLDPAAQA